MKKILLLNIIVVVFGNYNFAQSNLFFGNKNALSVSTTLELVEGKNNIIIVSPYYSINGNYDFGLNIGYSLKEPNTFILNPLAFMHLFNDEINKIPFNIAYGIGYRYEFTSMTMENIKTEFTANYIQLYYLLYYSMTMLNIVIQPQLNGLVFIGETKSTTYSAFNSTYDNSPNTFTHIKVGLAFIYNTNKYDVHLLPSIFLDNKGKTFSLQIGVTL